MSNGPAKPGPLLIRECTTGYHTFPANERDPKKQTPLTPERLLLFETAKGRITERALEKKVRAQLKALTAALQKDEGLSPNAAAEEAQKRLEEALSEFPDAFSYANKESGIVSDSKRVPKPTLWYTFECLPVDIAGCLSADPAIIAASLSSKVSENEVCGILADERKADGTTVPRVKTVAMPGPLAELWGEKIARAHPLRLSPELLSGFLSEIKAVPEELSPEDLEKLKTDGEKWMVIQLAAPKSNGRKSAADGVEQFMMVPQEAFHLIANFKALGVPEPWKILRPLSVTDKPAAGMPGSGDFPTSPAEMLQNRSIRAAREYAIRVDALDQDVFRAVVANVGAVPRPNESPLLIQEVRHPVRTAMIQGALTPLIEQAKETPAPTIEELMTRQNETTQKEINQIVARLDEEVPFFGEKDADTEWVPNNIGFKQTTIAYLARELKQEGIDPKDVIRRIPSAIKTGFTIYPRRDKAVLDKIMHAISRVCAGLHKASTDYADLDALSKQCDFEKNNIKNEKSMDQNLYISIPLAITAAAAIPSIIKAAWRWVGRPTDFSPERLLRYVRPRWIDPSGQVTEPRHQLIVARAKKLWAQRYPSHPLTGWDVTDRNYALWGAIKNTKWRACVDEAERQEGIKDNLLAWGLDVELSPRGEVEDPHLGEEERLQIRIQREMLRTQAPPIDPLQPYPPADPLTPEALRIYETAERNFAQFQTDHQAKIQAAATADDRQKLQAQWNESDVRRAALNDAIYAVVGYKTKSGKTLTVFEKYTRNLLALATQPDKLEPMDPELRRKAIDELRSSIIQQRSHLFYGKPGVGKTMAVEGTAQEIAAGRIPELNPADTLMVELDLSEFVAGTKYRGSFEARIKEIINEINRQLEAGKRVIIFIDEIHRVVAAGGSEGTESLAEHIKPLLARRGCTVVGATTTGELKHILANPALARRFSMSELEELTPEQALQALRARVKFHGKATAPFPEMTIEGAALERLIAVTQAYADRVWNLTKQEEYLPAIADKMLSVLVGDKRREQATTPEEAQTLTAADVDRLMGARLGTKIPAPNDPLPPSPSVTNEAVATPVIQLAEKDLLTQLAEVRKYHPSGDWNGWDAYIRRILVNAAREGGPQRVTACAAELGSILHALGAQNNSPETHTISPNGDRPIQPRVVLYRPDGVTPLVADGAGQGPKGGRPGEGGFVTVEAMALPGIAAYKSAWVMVDGVVNAAKQVAPAQIGRTAVGGLAYTLGEYGSTAVMGAITGNWSQFHQISGAQVAADYATLTIAGEGLGKSLADAAIVAAKINHPFVTAAVKRSIPLFVAVEALELVRTGKLQTDPAHLVATMGTVIGASTATHGLVQLGGQIASRVKWVDAAAKALRLVRAGAVAAAPETGGATLLGAAVTSVIEFTLLKAIDAEVQAVNRAEVRRDVAGVIRDHNRALEHVLTGYLAGALTSAQVQALKAAQVRLAETAMQLKALDAAQYQAPLAEQIRAIEKERDAALLQPLDGRRSRAEIAERFDGTIAELRAEAQARVRRLDAQAVAEITPPEVRESPVYAPLDLLTGNRDPAIAGYRSKVVDPYAQRTGTDEEYAAFVAKRLADEPYLQWRQLQGHIDAGNRLLLKYLQPKPAAPAIPPFPAAPAAVAVAP